MTALVDTTASKYQATMAKLKDINLDLALQAGHAAFCLGEQLAVEALQSTSLDDKRKAYDSFTRKAEVPEKVEAQKATAEATSAFFNIILDRSAKQVPPPVDPDRIKRVTPTGPVEDAVLVPSDATTTDAWGEDL